jgi:hypothetical protein
LRRSRSIKELGNEQERRQWAKKYRISENIVSGAFVKNAMA